MFHRERLAVTQCLFFGVPSARARVSPPPLAGRSRGPLSGLPRLSLFQAHSGLRFEPSPPHSYTSSKYTSIYEASQTQSFISAPTYPSAMVTRLVILKKSPSLYCSRRPSLCKAANYFYHLFIAAYNALEFGIL